MNSEMSVLIVTGAGTYYLVIDSKTHKLKRILGTPEMPILKNYSEAAVAAATLLYNTKGLKGVEELRQQTTMFLTSMTEKVMAEVATKTV